eukprot:CAMPEP_0204079294 /NCGR_PEP_ID=MMETSP0360-20130528/172191_1 /ASSEMBLY_ACC=CAM_ASM_000342 /TAXON_ID=268821 /ORGANISM="Scrippsiella Hangoei, Strain SHTV-5" /LENGTH=59 /DNA_ID=CAMNT_0051028007 /DNA_START=11 /DNA_END=190 /DNA_ORIENTATION=-
MMRTQWQMKATKKSHNPIKTPTCDNPTSRPSKTKFQTKMPACNVLLRRLCSKARANHIS